MKISFVATRKNSDPTERELYEMDVMIKALGFQRSFLDLGLQTVAACTPKDIEIEIIDEYVEPIDYDMKTDLVALSAKPSCAPRAYEVADRFRAGIHASLRPEEALTHADCIVTGEAETLWPKVVRDFQARKMGERYDAEGFPDMGDIPVPAWSVGPSDSYLFHQIQTTRGCPFKCRFCSVPDISGQDFRFKPVDRVIHELRRLPKATGLIARSKPLYVVDDNFISRTHYTKELLEAMVPLAEAGEIPPWSAETTLNVASDDKLLDLFQRAGCTVLIIGFESVTEATLNDMDKPVNFCLTYQEAVERIHARGMNVVGNFIVGFDTDTTAVFRQTLEFIQTTGILFPFFSILTPMPGTKLFDDVKAEGRLDHEDWARYDTRHVVFEPKRMRRDELMDGYVWLYEQSYGTHLMLDRMERAWSCITQEGSNAAEKAFVTARLAGEYLRGDAELRDLYKRAFKMLTNRKLNGDIGQLLYLLDAYDFARFMRRFNTPNRAANYKTFETETLIQVASAEDLEIMQWENKKAVKRTKRRRSLPVMTG